MLETPMEIWAMGKGVLAKNRAMMSAKIQTPTAAVLKILFPETRDSKTKAQIILIGTHST